MKAKTLKERMETEFHNKPIKCETQAEMIMLINLFESNDIPIYSRTKERSMTSLWDEFSSLVYDNVEIQGDKRCHMSATEFLKQIYNLEITLPVINGYNGLIEDDIVKYGCVSIPMKLVDKFLDLNKMLGEENKIQSIKIQNECITLEEIQQIKEYADSKTR